MCIWPQQVCASGKTTSWPSRSSTCTVARPASGNSVSPMQVTKRAMRTPAYSSQLFVGALDGSRAPVASEGISVASVSERGDGILGNAELRSKAAEQRAHVRLERLEQSPVAAEYVTGELRLREPLLVDEQRLRVRRLDVHDRLDHRVDLSLDVV